MTGKLLIAIGGLLLGMSLGLFFIRDLSAMLPKSNSTVARLDKDLNLNSHQIIGFLPYWLLDKADKDYTKYVTTLSYFSLTLNGDGTIQKLINPTEEDPGWYSLRSGKADPFFASARKQNVQLSLVVFSADEEHIEELMSDPVTHAQNLVTDVAPLMRKHGFTDLNLDIESVSTASDEAREHFISFTKEVKKQITEQKLGTVTIDVSPTALIKNYLINVSALADTVDYFVFMTYDYHYQGSSVTGPVSPVGGARTEAEFDTRVAIEQSLKILRPQQILIGAPLYGYGWETIADTPRSATIPGTGLTYSNRKVEELLSECATCSAQEDTVAKEAYVIYKDDTTGTYYQIFYPNEQSMSEKIKLAQEYGVGGVALWALGYDGSTILNPLLDYKASAGD